MMRFMGHPDYEYRPTPDAVKERMSLAHRKRLGIPEGCAQVYGQHVPLHAADRVRSVAAEVSRLAGREAAEAVAKVLVTKGWLGPEAADPYEVVIAGLTAQRDRVDDALAVLEAVRPRRDRKLSNLG